MPGTWEGTIGLVIRRSQQEPGLQNTRHFKFDTAVIVIGLQIGCCGLVRLHHQKERLGESIPSDIAAGQEVLVEGLEAFSACEGWE